MKIKIKDVKAMSAIEREKKLSDLRADLFKTRSTSAMGGAMQDPSKIKETKRSIARILTVMRENNEV
jgi:large subunit ribosomal protein L29